MYVTHSCSVSQGFPFVFKGLCQGISVSYNSSVSICIGKIITGQNGYSPLKNDIKFCLTGHGTFVMYMPPTYCLQMQGRIQGGARGPGPPLITKNEAPAPKFYKIEAPEWQF